MYEYFWCGFVREGNLFDWLLVFLRLRGRFTVSGASMFPTLAEGDEVVVDYGAYRCKKPSVGDVVVAVSPDGAAYGRIVKRVVGIAQDGRFFLQGDNPEESTDSRHYGPLPVHYILGKVVCKF